jgi:hypothetical protein
MIEKRQNIHYTTTIVTIKTTVRLTAHNITNNIRKSNPEENRIGPRPWSQNESYQVGVIKWDRTLDPPG